MSWVSERNLVSAISNAGGFGVIACGAMTPELLDAEIAGTKALTAKPFGVNLITMHPALVQAMMDDYRVVEQRLAQLKEQTAQWAARKDDAAAEIETLAEQGVEAEEKAVLLAAQVEEQAQQLPDLEESLRQAQAKATEQQKAATKERDELDLQIELRTTRSTDLAAQVKALEDKAADLENKLSDLSDTDSRLKDSNEALKAVESHKAEVVAAVAALVKATRSAVSILASCAVVKAANIKVE